MTENTVPVVKLVLAVYADAVHATVEQYGRRVTIGWFRDEVCATAAACERLMMSSAILPTLRQLPELRVVTTYCNKKSNRKYPRFARATVVKPDPLGRRVVLLPDATSKTWVSAA